ncbi:type II toxin-antitoxin system prevent-host-death family antitoxin [Aquisalimonas sp.]|uniref:type II toxin-antitoxin system Phd/YefM family antitoxin n=1 Tax=Aquisalimonas sp. TaxID=1872621 RepID=UPI0025C0C467|nr:type II toxin-antitoxin system prevent-host-death family antitoxin [Aquisalimonas sp.]
MSDTREIQSYSARVRWSRLLDEVGAGTSYVISKRNRPVAALVPIEQWRQVTAGDDTPEARELAMLVEQLKERNAEAEAALDRAFDEIAKTRQYLAEARAERNRQQAENAASAADAGDTHVR